MNVRRLLLLLLVLALLAAACDLDRRVARDELRDEGFTEIDLTGDIGTGESVYAFTATREGKACSGVLTVRRQDGQKAASIVSQCEGADAAPLSIDR